MSPGRVFVKIFNKILIKVIDGTVRTNVFDVEVCSAVSSGAFDVEARTAISSDVFDVEARTAVSSDVFDDQGERRGVSSDVFDDQGERRGGIIFLPAACQVEGRMNKQMDRRQVRLVIFCRRECNF